MAGFLDALKGAGAPAQASPFLAALAKAPPPAAIPESQAPATATLGQRLGAIPTGFNAGVAQLLGMPVDLASAGLNLLPHSLHTPVSGAQMGQVPLSSAWFEHEMNSSPLGNLTHAPAPKDWASEILHGVSSFVPALMTGNPFESEASRMADRAGADLARIPGAKVPGQTRGPIATALRSALTRSQQKAADAGEPLGLRLTPGQRLGSKPLQQIEAAAASHAWTSGPFAKLAAGNANVMDRVAANSIGESTEPHVDTETLGDADTRLGDIFDRVRTPNVNLDVKPDDSLAFLRNLDEENEGLLPNDSKVSDHPLARTFSGLMTRAAGRAANRDAFINAMEGMATRSAGVPGEGTVDGVRFGWGPSAIGDGTADLKLLEAPDGANVGKALQKVTSLADSHGVTLAMPQAPGALAGNLENAIEALHGARFQAGGPLASNDWIPLRRPPQVTAKQLGPLSSKLGRAAYKSMTSQGGDRDLGKALFALKDHVDDTLEANLSPEGQAAYSKARGEYRNLMHLVSRGNIVNSATGHVNPVALASRLKSADRAGYLFGKNQSSLYNIARFGEAFKPVVGDSGTATRSANVFNPLEWATGGPANLAMRLYLSPKGSALASRAIDLAGGAPGAVRSLAGLPLRYPFLGPLLAAKSQAR